MNDLSNDVMEYKKGDVLFTKDESANFLYIVVSGTVKLFSGDEKSLRPVKNIYEKDFFGEQSLFSEEARTLTAIVAEDSKLILIKRRDIFSVLKTCPDWIGDIVTLIGKRLRSTNYAIYEHHLVDEAITSGLEVSTEDFTLYKSRLGDYKRSKV
jgi:CRP/FNR family cyclic AMP-dependent transcriptional regulator